MSPASAPALVFSTPRKLPKPASLVGRVAVLDIAFAAEGSGSGFDKITKPFIQGLGDRLAVWVDHHDHQLHPRYQSDARFVLATKQMHGACPEMITPALVARVGAVDTIVCHNDLDGLYSAAKFILGGEEPYAGADDDARAVDTRIGEPGPFGAMIDRSLRGPTRDDALLRDVVRLLTVRPEEPELRARIEASGAAWQALCDHTRALADARYVVRGKVAVCSLDGVEPRSFDKTELLLAGQRKALVAMVLDAQNVTLAAPFDSGLNFLSLLSVSGGMPTVLSVQRAREPAVIEALRKAGLHP